MSLTAGAGGAAHHIILLWPFHLIAMAVVLAEIPWRPAAALLTAMICVAGLLVINTYYVALKTNGTSVRWTDAFPALISALQTRRPRWCM